MRVKLLATMAMGVMAAACMDKRTPKLASASFSIARAGSAISIPFTVGPSAELGHRYMLAFKFRRPAHNDPTMAFWGTQALKAFRLRVKLVRIGQKHESLVRVHDHFAMRSDGGDAMRYRGESIGPGGADIAYVSMHGHAGGEALMEVVYFTLPGRGLYRFDVETLDDMPIFENVDSCLTVEREYRHVK